MDLDSGERRACSSGVRRARLCLPQRAVWLYRSGWQVHCDGDSIRQLQRRRSLDPLRHRMVSSSTVDERGRRRSRHLHPSHSRSSRRQRRALTAALMYAMDRHIGSRPRRAGEAAPSTRRDNSPALRGWGTQVPTPLTAARAAPATAGRRPAIRRSRVHGLSAQAGRPRSSP